jgi:hypothetical protein
MPAPYLTRIIERYRRLRQQRPDTHIQFTLSQPTFHDALVVAAKAVNQRNKIHGHQCRPGRLALEAFASCLQQFEPQLEQAQTFDEILSIVAQAKVPNINKTTFYDTAHRIGLYRQIPPDKIYLHAGTGEGAKRLFGPLGKKKHLLLSEMPPEFQRPDLTASELEDILCIYKDEFRLYGWSRQ